MADGAQHLVADGAAGVQAQKVDGGLAREGDADGLRLPLLCGQLGQLLGVPLDQHAFVFHVQLCLVGHCKHHWLVVATGALDQGKAARALLYQLVQAGDGAGLLLHDGGGVHVKMPRLGSWGGSQAKFLVGSGLRPSFTAMTCALPRWPLSKPLMTRSTCWGR